MQEPMQSQSVEATVTQGESLTTANRTLRWITISVILLISVSLAAVGWFLDTTNNKSYQEQVRNNVLNELSIYRARLEGQISYNLQTIHGLVAAIQTDPNPSVEFFNKLSESLFEDHPELLSIGAAPNFIVEYVYPYEPNQAIIGYDYRSNETQWLAAQNARDSGKLILEGPRDIFFDKETFVGRIPVFIGEKNNKAFWGIIFAIIDSDELFRNSGITNTESIKIALRGRDGAGAAGEPFFGDEGIYAQNPVSSTINLPGGSWEIVAVPTQGWPSVAPSALVLRSLIFSAYIIVIGLLFFIAYILRKRQQEHNNLLSFFDLSPVGIALNDYKTGSFLQANHALTDPTGYTQDEFFALTHLQLAPEEYWAVEKEHIGNLQKTGSFGPFEIEHLRKDGSRYPVRLRGLLINEKSDNPLVWTIVEDISQQKQNEQYLERQNQQIELIINSTAIGIWDWDLITGDAVVSNRWLEIAGFKKEDFDEITINLWKERVHPDDYKIIVKNLEEHWRGESEHYSSEYRFKHIDGHWLWTMDTGKVVEWTDSGKPKRMVGTHLDITAQKSVQDRIARSQEELQKFFDLSNNVLCITNLRGEFKKVNQALCNILGYSESELLTMNALDILHPDCVDDTRELITRLAAGEPLSGYTNRHITKDGEEVILLWNCAPDPQSGDLFSSAIDITAQRALDIKLARQQERLTEMSRQAKIGAWEIDLETGTTYWSSMVKTIHEVAEDFEPTIKSSLMFFKEGESRNKVVHAVRACMRFGEAFDIEVQQITANDREIWVKLTGSAEILNDKVVRIFGSFQDITSRKVSEKYLQEAHRELEQQMTLVQIIAKTQYNFIAETNIGIAFDGLLSDLLELTESEFGFIGEIFYRDDGTPYLLTHAISNIAWNQSTLDYYLENLQTGIEFNNLDTLFGVGISTLQPVISNTPQSDDRAGGLPEGHPALNSFLGIPVSRTGRGIAMIGIANRPGGYDMSIVNWLQPLTSTLGQIVESLRATKAREKAESDLLSAKEAAETAAIAKSDFLATMSHEIRTPMNGVLGMLNLLDRSSLDSSQQRKVSIAKSSAESLLLLINDILDFSKVDAGKMELEELDFNMSSMLGDFIEAMGVRAQEKGLELVLDLTALDRNMFRGDPGRIRQLFTNLVGNAIKFTDKGEILVRCKSTVADGAHFFTAEVQDSGIGIPEEKLSQLFDPFTQVDASTTRQYGGTGLGLAICKKLCATMNGDISVESKKNVGSKFTFTVCLKPSNVLEPEFPIAAPEKMTALIVENNLSSRSVIEQQLSKWQVKTLTCESETEALDILTDPRYSELVNVVLIDVQPSSTSGESLARNIRLLSGGDRYTLIAMTHMAHQGDSEHCTTVGFNGFLPKPVTPDDLKNALSITDRRASGLDTPTLISNPVSYQQIAANQWPEKTRILLVDDNSVNLEVATIMLNDIGIFPDVAGNGVEALDALRNAPLENPYTLILMDCQMPEMDGYAASRAIRNGDCGSNNTDIPIIALTANAMKGDDVKCFDAGMNDYLTKPIDDQLLEIKLREWLLKDSAPLTVHSKPEPDDAAKESVAPAISATSIAPNAEASTSNTTTKNAKQEWDEAAALKMLKGRTERLCILLNSFCDHAPQRITDFETAFENKDFEQLRFVAHAIKGSAAQLKGFQLQGYAADLELAAREEDWENIESNAPLFTTAYQQLVGHFQNYLQSQNQ